MTTVRAIMEGEGIPRLGLVKIDIEGGEQQLFDGPTEWLASTDAIIAEFHPALADCSRIVKTISSRGFDYIPANSVFADNMESFKSKGHAAND